MNLAFLMLALWIPLVVHPVKDEATRQMLRDVVGEPDPVVQELATEALAAIDNIPVPVVPRLDRDPAELGPGALRATNLFEIERAVREAAESGDGGAVTELLVLLKTEDEGLRISVLEALRTLAPDAADSAVVPAIVNRLDQEPSLRACEAAGRVLVAIHDADAERALLTLLRHTSPLVRLAAVHALTVWADEALAPALHPLLSDSEEAVAAATAEGLEKLGNADSAEPLLERLPDAPPSVQVKICHALGAFQMLEASSELQALFNKEPDRVSAAATAALGQLGDRDVIPLLREPLEQVTAIATGTRREAIKALRLLGDMESGAVMWKIVTQRVVPTPMGPVLDAQENREEGLRYMAASGDSRYAAALVNTAGSQDAMMESVVVEALRTIHTVGTSEQMTDFLWGLRNAPIARDRPTICEMLHEATDETYEPLPDESHRHYFVESLGPVPYRSVPAPPAIRRVQSADEE